MLNKKTMYLALICVLVFVSSGYGADEEEILGKVNAGVEAGNAIVQVLADENLSKTFGKIGEIASKIGPFLGAIGPAIALITIFLPQSPSPEMQLMKKKFEEMDQKFDQVFAQFDEVKNLIQETSLKAQYGEYDHTISALSHRLEQFLTASAEAVEGQKATFITAYESSYGSATYKLWRGMMGETVLSDNILEIAIKYTENDRGRVQKMMKGVANLILQGVKIHLFYLKAKGRDATYEEEKETWEDHIIQLTDHMQEVDQKVTNAWKSQSVEDLSTKLASLNGKSNSDFADKFYDFVSKKYDWRDWNVVVYNPISGQDNHRIRACNGKHYYRTHGRNVIMGSVDQSKAAINRGIALDVFRKAKTVYTYQFIFGYHQGPWGATNVFDSLPTQFRTGCSPYAAVGVIDKDAGIQYRAPFRRLAIKTNGEYKLHAFG